MSSSTCHKHLSPEAPPSFFQNGDAVFQAHHVGWIVCGVFTAVSTAVSFWLIDKHLVWYTNKKQQRYIVRLLFLVPIYGIISFASFLFWNQSTPLILVRDAYEAIVLTAFFYLLLNYLSPDPEEQKRIFLKAGLSRENDARRRHNGEKLRKWVWPMGFVKWKPEDGLYFLQLMKWGILQYCVIRPLTTLIAVILDYNGLYCEASWAPKWGHLWIVLLISISVTIAMYCLIQLYMPVAKELKPHRPILKLFAVKAVVFLTFWQATFLSLFSLVGVVKDGKYMTAEDINIGIGAILECFEMMLFAFLHVKAFTYKPYRPFYDPTSKEAKPSKTPRLRSLGHVLDFRETFREIWTGCIYLFDKMRGKEPTPDFSARRGAHYEQAFGRSRPAPTAPQLKHKKGQVSDFARQDETQPAPQASGITIDQQVEVEVGGERQWLGIGDDYGYGLGYFRRERSDALSVQIDKELQTRGYSSDSVQAIQGTDPLQRNQVDDLQQSHFNSKPRRRRSTSWWRNLYDRISQTGHGPGDGSSENDLTPSMPRRLQGGLHPGWSGSEARRELLRDTDHESPSDPSPVASGSQPVPHLRTVAPSIDDNGPEPDVLAPLSVYQSRRRSSYRPKRHRVDSSSSLLPNSTNRRSDGDSHHLNYEDDYFYVAELGIRPSHELLAVPSTNNRPDSLLNRLFPASEAGSMNDFLRENDSAFSLSVDDHHYPHQHINHSGGVGVLETRQFPNTHTAGGQLVHERMIHPSRSTTAMHTPWMADIVNVHSRTTLYHDDGDHDVPPTPPAKDFPPAPPASPPSSPQKGSLHRREVANYFAGERRDSPTTHHAPQGPSRIPVDSPTSFTTFSSYVEQNPVAFSPPEEPRSPPASHTRAVWKGAPPPAVIPLHDPPSGRGPSRRTIGPPRRQQPAAAAAAPHATPDPPSASSSSSRPFLNEDPYHHRLRAAPQLQLPIFQSARDGALSPNRQLRLSQRPQSVDSDRMSDVSINTFYTARSDAPQDDGTKSSRRT